MAITMTTLRQVHFASAQQANKYQNLMKITLDNDYGLGGYSMTAAWLAGTSFTTTLGVMLQGPFYSTGAGMCQGFLSEDFATLKVLSLLDGNEVEEGADLSDADIFAIVDGE